MSVRLALAETKMEMEQMDQIDGEAEATALADGDTSRIRHSFFNSLVIPRDMVRYASKVQGEYLEEDQASVLVRQFLEDLPDTDDLGNVPRVNVHMLLVRVFDFSDNEIARAPRYLTSNIARVLDNECPDWHRMEGKQRVYEEYGLRNGVVHSYGIATAWERDY